MRLLDDISTRGAQVRERLRQLFLRHEYPPDTKTFLLRAYVDIALEYHEAIWLLTKSKLNGSAFAMVRLLYDAMFRAFWINKVATEQEIEQATHDELGFPIEKICGEIKRDYFCDRPPKEAQQFDSFRQLIKEAWGSMCSYTHSGALQLARRFTGDELKPNYSEGETAESTQPCDYRAAASHARVLRQHGVPKGSRGNRNDAASMGLRGATSGKQYQ